MTKHGKFTPELLKIRLKFLDKLQGWVPQLQEFFDTLDGDFVENENVKTKFHQLYGSAKTFGFPKVTEMAGEIESALEKLQKTTQKKARDEIILELKKLFASFVKIADEAFKSRDEVPEYPVHDHAAADVKPEIRHVDKKYKIFSVDDDTLIHDFLQSGFEKVGCEVIALENGEAVFEKLKQEIPDLIILDLNMAGMNGMEVLKKLKADKKYKNVPVMMLTKYRKDRDVLASFAYGVVDYMVKPFEIEDLIARSLEIVKMQNVKVLIVDDDVLITEVVEQKLLKKGYVVLKCNSGSNALDMIEKHKPSLVILDIMLPGMDGITILKHMKADPNIAEIPVIILTAKRQQDNILKCLKSGAYDCITKPFDPEEVVIKIDTILQRNGLI